MAAWNRSRDVNSDPEHSGGTSRSRSRPPLPRPDSGDNVRPVPLWEREFCRNAYGIPWETFCENKRYVEILFKNVMDWDDSGALKNFKDAKERFRAKYFGEPYEDPVLDPDMYIDEVDHHCEVNLELVAVLDKIAGLDLVSDLGWGGMANVTMDWGAPIGSLIPPGWGNPVPNLTPNGWGESGNPTPDSAWGGQCNQTPGLSNVTPMDWGAPTGNLIPPGWGKPVPNLPPTGWGESDNPTPTPDSAWGGQCNQTPGTVMGAQPYSTPNNSNNNFHGGAPSNRWHKQGVDPGQKSSGSARMLPGGGRIWMSGVSSGGGSAGKNWYGGGGGGGGRAGSYWNGGGRGNQRILDEGRLQQRNHGGMESRNRNEGQHQMKSVGLQQQGQRGRRMEWRPVQRNRAPKDDPAA